MIAVPTLPVNYTTFVHVGSRLASPCLHISVSFEFHATVLLIDYLVPITIGYLLDSFWYVSGVIS